jgi:hypothetical protein
MAKGRLRTYPLPPGAWTEIQLIGSDGQQRWSSADKIWRTTDVLKGSISFSVRSTPINTVTTHTLGSCNAASNWVLGYMRMSAITLQPGQLSPFPAVGDWYYVSGTYLGLSTSNSGGDNAAAYTFTASGGVVRLEEQLVAYEIGNDVGQTFPFPPFTIEYELWIGHFPT